MSYEALNPPRDPFHGHNWMSQAAMLWSRPYVVPVEEVSAEAASSMRPAVDLEYHVARLKAAWERELGSAVPSFYKAVRAAFWWKFTYYSIPLVLAALGQLGVSLTLYFLTASLQSEHSSLADHLAWALLFCGLSLLAVCLINQGYLRAHLLSIIIRNSIYIAIQEKVLSLSSSKLANELIRSRAINLLSSQLDIFEHIVALRYIFITPLFLLVAGPVLYWLIGISGVIGMVVVIAVLPVKVALSRFVRRSRKHNSDLTEKRLKALRTLIGGIKSVKAYGWESELIAEIEALKGEECEQYFKLNAHDTLTATVTLSGGVLSIFVMFTIYVLLGNQIHTGSAFAATAIILSVNANLGLWMRAIDMLAWLRVVFTNLTEFMSLPAQREQRRFLSAGIYDAVCEQATVNWDQQSELNSPDPQPAPVLHQIELRITKGELCVVVGKVGSGKTSLLTTFAGGLNITEGSVAVNPNSAYVEQEAWIAPDTVRNNILMGEVLEEQRYNETIQMCALASDIQEMKNGDLTVVGDHGSTLSGGQKSRIALARTVYRRKEMYFLDDPLSAVDVTVGEQIFTQCILTGLKDTTRVLVTNQHRYLSQADRVVILTEGRTALQGTYEDVKDSAELASVIVSFESEENSLQSVQSRETADFSSSIEALEEPLQPASVPISLYLSFLQLYFNSKLKMFCLFFLIVLLEVVYLISFYWISYWAFQSESRQKAAIFIWAFAIIIALLILLSVLRSLIVMNGLSISSTRLHNKALTGVANTDLTFYDTNKEGHIISRFSTDTAMVDNAVMKYYSDLIQTGPMVIGSLLAALVTNPPNIVFGAPLMAAEIAVCRYYIPLCKQWRRVELSTKARVVALASTSIHGSRTIRSLQLTQYFQTRFLESALCNFQSAFCFYVNIRTFQSYFDYLAIGYMIGNVILAAFLVEYLSVDFLVVGFSFTVLLIGLLGAFSTQFVGLGNYIVSADRLFEYAALPPESDSYAGNALQITEGEVQFQSVYLKYRPDLDFALRDLSFTVSGGSKVGIVGRTGAGKSSIVLAILRLKEISSGRILIDGQHTATVSLRDLRSKISVIPQSPLLFHSTVRGNIDPTSQSSAAQIDAVLEDLDMLDVAESDAHQLSVGQKQLLCLARALLRNSQVMVYDEATANIDPRTEHFLQEKLRERLAEKTVLVIAHRMKTIELCDSVLVMENGSCVESGNPQDLLSTNSKFAELFKVSNS